MRKVVSILEGDRKRAKVRNARKKSVDDRQIELSLEPQHAKLSASSHPIFPDDRFPINRTGSIAS